MSISLRGGRGKDSRANIMNGMRMVWVQVLKKELRQLVKRSVSLGLPLQKVTCTFRVQFRQWHGAISFCISSL
jgi:hypothetical protein